MKLTRNKYTPEHKFLTESEAKLVADYRASKGLSHGYVVVFDGEITGWISNLNSPNGFIAGCIAVSSEGNCYEAIGGNEYDGAEQWFSLIEGYQL